MADHMQERLKEIKSRLKAEDLTFQDVKPHLLYQCLIRKMNLDDFVKEAFNQKDH